MQKSLITLSLYKRLVVYYVNIVEFSPVDSMNQAAENNDKWISKLLEPMDVQYVVTKRYVDEFYYCRFVDYRRP